MFVKARDTRELVLDDVDEPRVVISDVNVVNAIAAEKLCRRGVLGVGIQRVRSKG